MTWKWWWALLAVIALAGVSLIALLSRSSPGAGTGGSAPAGAPALAEAPAPALEFLPQDLYTVRREPLERALPITGTLAPLVEASVKAKVAGELTAVTVREGEAVKEGEVLARIDPVELRANVAARRAELEATRSQLALARKNLEQQRTLMDKGFISKSAFQSAESNFEVARSRVQSAQAALATAREQLDYAEVRAPFAGIVAARLAQPGERVAVDAPIVRLVDLSQLALDAPVPAERIAEVHVGQPVRFHAQGFGERGFSGRVDRINPTTTSGTRAVPVHVVIDNPDGTLRGGLFATGDIVLERLEGALPVPQTAVREAEGRAFVYEVQDGILRRQPVQLGTATRAGTVDVREGLQPGDVIVRNNLGELRPGARVRVPEVAAQAGG